MLVMFNLAKGGTMDTVRSLRNILSGLVVVGLGLSTATLPASATSSQVDDPQAVSVPMEAVALTADNAIAYGYDVRIDADGQQWAVAPDAPEGDFTHGVPIPAADGAATQELIAGNCGNAWVWLNGNDLSRTIYTGYQIWANKGAPVSQSWYATVISSIDITARDYSGLAVWGSQQWYVSEEIPTQALKGTQLSAVAGGSVLTTEIICTSGSPTDSITWKW